MKELMKNGARQGLAILERPPSGNSQVDEYLAGSGPRTAVGLEGGAPDLRASALLAGLAHAVKEPVLPKYLLTLALDPAAGLLYAPRNLSRAWPFDLVKAGGVQAVERFRANVQVKVSSTTTRAITKQCGVFGGPPPDLRVVVAGAESH